jgi:cellobiose phosphorylase
VYWSATFKPVMHRYDHFSVVHGIGYSKFTQQIEEIHSELTVFVSAQDPVQIFQLKLTNYSSEARLLDITSYAEWLLGFAPDEHREFHKLFIETSADATASTVFARKCLWGFPDDKGRHNNTSWPFTAFMAVSEPLKSYDCDKESYGLATTTTNPRPWLTARCTQNGMFTDAIASRPVQLATGESKTVVSLWQVEDGKEDTAELISHTHR